MNQLQTVLDALEQWTDETPRCDLGALDAKIHESITIVKQMMQAEPVACLVETEQGVMVWPIDDFNDAGTYCEPNQFRSISTPTHPAPQAVPAGWVSLEDGMPSPHQMVLVARESHVTTGSYTPAFGWAWEEVDGEDEDSIATHWMPLPAPPKGAV
jgi:hypothetical protein